MATGGQPPTPAHLKLITGNPGHRPVPTTEPVVQGEPVKPHWLAGRGAELWEWAVRVAPWLCEADSPMLAQWCFDEARYEDLKVRAALKTAEKREHRAAAQELGLSGGSRARMALVDPSAKYRRTPVAPDGSGGKPTRPATKYLG